MAGLSRQKKTKEHHNLLTVALVCEERNIKQLTAAIERFTNLFTEESDDLFNLVTKVVVADKVDPFAPRDFAEKRVLKLVEWFSGHCRAIKS